MTLSIVGGPCRGLIVWSLFWSVRPFSELLRATHIPKKVLRKELGALQRQGVVSVPGPTSPYRKTVYGLTAFGETLKPLVALMYEWGLFALKRPPH